MFFLKTRVAINSVWRDIQIRGNTLSVLCTFDAMDKVIPHLNGGTHSIQHHASLCWLTADARKLSQAMRTVAARQVNDPNYTLPAGIDFAITAHARSAIRFKPKL